MANTYSAGIVTAYGAAVRGGYTGTYEEFCAQQAAFAENAEQVAEDRAAVEQIKNTFENQTVPAAVGQVNQAGAAQVQAVQAAGADEESDISAAGSTQVAAVNAAGSTQVTAVQAAGAAQVTAVQGAGTTQVAAVNAAGATQVDAVEDKGEEVLASIPQDYSALSGEVDDLKSAITKSDTKSGTEFLLVDALEKSTVSVEGTSGTKVFVSGGNIAKPLHEEEQNGIRLTVDADGTIHLNGTSTQSTALFVTPTDERFTLYKGKYTYFAHNPVIQNRVNIRLLDNYTTIGDTQQLESKDFSYTVELNADVTRARIGVAVVSGTTLNDFIIRPQLVQGEVDSIPYLPYSKGLSVSTVPFSVVADTSLFFVSDSSVTFGYQKQAYEEKDSTCNFEKLLQRMGYTNSDDVTDALQYAVDNYEKVFIPNGDYIIKRTVVISKSICIEGQDKFRSIMYGTGTILSIEMTGTWNEFTVSDLTFRTISSTPTDMINDTSLLYIHIENAGIGENRFGNISNCAFLWGYNGVFIDHTALVKVRMCEFYAQTGTSIIMASDDEVSECFITASGIGVEMRGGNSRLINSKVYQNGRDRVSATQGVTNELPGVYITGNRNILMGCDIQENYANGIEVRGFNNRIDATCDANGYVSETNKNGLLISGAGFGGFNLVITLIACNHTNTIKQSKAIAFNNSHNSIENVYAVVTEDGQIDGMSESDIFSGVVVIHNGDLWKVT